MSSPPDTYRLSGLSCLSWVALETLWTLGVRKQQVDFFFNVNSRWGKIMNNLDFCMSICIYLTERHTFTQTIMKSPFCPYLYSSDIFWTKHKSQQSRPHFKSQNYKQNTPLSFWQHHKLQLLHQNHHLISKPLSSTFKSKITWLRKWVEADHTIRLRQVSHANNVIAPLWKTTTARAQLQTGRH